ncbi:hypothetical protein [Streptomyces sp. NBC_00658]|uniref:hypothetical protein n=1 Tax=Streptomyces sp. NBC_00658 TaxID=2975800 RepID=UPI00324CDE5A
MPETGCGHAAPQVSALRMPFQDGAGRARAPAVLPGGGGRVGDSLVDGDAVECGLNTGHQAGLRTHRRPGVAADGAGSGRGGAGFHTAQERCAGCDTGGTAEETAAAERRDGSGVRGRDVS